MNIKGLVGHKGGGVAKLNNKGGGRAISGFENFKGGRRLPKKR